MTEVSNLNSIETGQPQMAILWIMQALLKDGKEDGYIPGCRSPVFQTTQLVVVIGPWVVNGVTSVYSLGQWVSNDQVAVWRLVYVTR